MTAATDLQVFCLTPAEKIYLSEHLISVFIFLFFWSSLYCLRN